MPRQRNSMLPTRAMSRRKRFLVSSTHIALVGGRLDRAAFQLTPCLGSNMSGYLPMALGATTRGQWRSCEARPAAIVCSSVSVVVVIGRGGRGRCWPAREARKRGRGRGGHDGSGLGFSATLSTLAPMGPRFRWPMQIATARPSGWACAVLCTEHRRTEYYPVVYRVAARAKAAKSSSPKHAPIHCLQLAPSRGRVKLTLDRPGWVGPRDPLPLRSNFLDRMGRNGPAAPSWFFLALESLDS